MKKLKGILFDFNGTLLFDSKMHIAAFRETFPVFGVSKPTDDYLIANVFGRTNAQIYYENCAKNGGSREECEAFRVAKEEAYYRACLADTERFHLAKGVPEMLDFINASGIPYCMATGSGEDEVRFFMEHLGLDRWFPWERIVYTDGTFNGKPAPDCYIMAARRIGLTPADCLVFEDGASGIRAAQAAGAGAVVAVYEQGLPSPLTGGLTADAVYHSFRNWRQILANFGYSALT